MKVVLPTPELFVFLLVANVGLVFPCEHANQLQAQDRYQYRPIAGKPHVDFKLPSIEDGKPVSLSDFRGKKLLLFHFASW